MKTKLRAKDLIYAGAFAALYLVLIFVSAAATGFAPIGFLIRPFLVGIVCAPVYMLYVAKVKKFGAILILGVLFGLITMSQTIFSLALAIVLALIAEFICKSGNYESKLKTKISFMIFNINIVGPYLILLYAKPRYLEMIEDYSGPEYAVRMDALMPTWIILLLAAIAVIGAIIGTAFAGKLMKKHFEKAGIV